MRPASPVEDLFGYPHFLQTHQSSWKVAAVPNIYFSDWKYESEQTNLQNLTTWGFYTKLKERKLVVCGQPEMKYDRLSQHWKIDMEGYGQPKENFHLKGSCHDIASCAHMMQLNALCIRAGFSYVGTPGTKQWRGLQGQNKMHDLLVNRDWTMI